MLGALTKRVPAIGRSALCASARERVSIRSSVLLDIPSILSPKADQFSLSGPAETGRYRDIMCHLFAPPFELGLAEVFQFNGTESRQIIRRGARTWVVRVAATSKPRSEPI
jgi:hypothetical protein